MKFLHFLCFILFSQVFFGQTSNWKIFSGIQVKNSSGILANPWSGSFNNAQVNSIDLNLDGLEDLWIFDRVAQRSIVFRQENKQWIYDYALEKSLPIISDWLLVEDYDGDGKKDVFTSTSAGIKVLRNVSKDAKLNFELVANPLKEEGFSGEINLYVASTDIPVIKDIDGDGDVDILAFESAGHVIELHENTSFNLLKTKGLRFEKKSGCWGNIVYKDCSSIYLNQGCSIPGVLSLNPKNSPNLTMHSGNALAAFSVNGLYDIIMGHVGCENLIHIPNSGTKSEPYFSVVNYQFPGKQSVALPFAATSFADVDFDEQLDALVTPNSSDNLTYQVDFKQSLSFLKQNKGTFDFKQSDFLQSTAIDVGENASPVWFDSDADGDLDLLIGNAMGQVWQYERNTSGFVLTSTDFANFSNVKSGNEIKLSVGDFNQDGVNDLMALSQSVYGPQLHVLNASQKLWQKVKLGDLLPDDQLLWMDTDLDGKLESLILHRSGQVDLVEWQKNGESYQLKVNISNWGNLPNLGLILQSFVLIDELGTGQLTLIGVDRDGNFRKALHENNRWRIVPTDSGLSNRFGKNVLLHTVNLNEDGKKDLMLGTSGGGVMLFQNTSESAIFESKNKLFQLWPNPSAGEFFVRSTEKGNIKIFNMQGEIIYQQADFPKNESIKIVLNDYFKGVYFVQLVSESGKVSSEKIIIP